MKNLTSGNIRSQLMFLALPLIAGNMLQQFYHTIDALVIGRFAAPAQAYLVIIFCGLMTTFLYNFCSAVLRAAGDTRAALFFLAAAVCANLALDLVFVALLHRGVAGAGWATILSQGISVLLCLLYMKQKAPVLLLHRDDMVLEPFLLKRTWRCCSVTALHQSSVYIGKLLVQGTVNSLGTGTIAAFTAASRIEGFANSFSTGLPCPRSFPAYRRPLTWEMSPARALKKGKARGVSENPTLPRASFPHPYDFAG